MPAAKQDSIGSSLVRAGIELLKVEGHPQNRQPTRCLYRSPIHVEGSTLCYEMGKREQ